MSSFSEIKCNKVQVSKRSVTSRASPSVISNFIVIPIHWLLQLLKVDAEMAFFLFRLLLRICLFSFNSCNSRKNDCLTVEFHSKFHFAIHAISFFRAKFTS